MPRLLLGFFGIAHLAFGIAGLMFPRWFYAALPPWPPLHIGQLQIAGVFDVSLAILFLGGARDPRRYLPVVAPTGAAAELGHAAVRIGHIVAGDNSPADFVGPSAMLAFGVYLIVLTIRRAFDATEQLV
jgi:hypothetical protein